MVVCRGFTVVVLSAIIGQSVVAALVGGLDQHSGRLMIGENLATTLLAYLAACLHSGGLAAAVVVVVGSVAAAEANLRSHLHLSHRHRPRRHSTAN